MGRGPGGGNAWRRGGGTGGGAGLRRALFLEPE